MPASLARALAADGDWPRLVTEPDTGALLNYGRTTYAPPQPLVDHLLARDGTCRFFGCAHAAERCDVDHVVPWDRDGETSRGNCCVLCRFHHRLKTHTGWRLQLGADGQARWTSPAGRTYVVPPQDHRPEA